MCASTADSYPSDTRPPEAVRQLVVCGDDSLAYRLISELTSRYSAEVTAIMPSKRCNHGPRIERLPHVRIVESEKLDSETFHRVGLQRADAIAMVRQDDVGNIHASLQAQEINPNIRLVIRMFNIRLGYKVRGLFHDCAVLSDARMAAPAFVAAALGEIASAYVRVHGKNLYVARGRNVPPTDILCGLTRLHEDSDLTEVLPGDSSDADLVLAVANRQSSALVHPMMMDEGREAEGRLIRSRVWKARLSRWQRRFIWPLSNLVNHKLRWTLVILVMLIMAGTIVAARVWHLPWWGGAYLTILTTLGGAEPDLEMGFTKKIFQVCFALISIALIPVVTAVVVEAVVNAKLVLTHNRLHGPVSDHVVVVGLGDVGTRVIRELHSLGISVVAVDKSEVAKGCPLARRLGIPLIIGDASQEETLRVASVASCQALVCLSTDDITNLEAALYGRELKDDLRVVLRLFDGDFADRVQNAFGVTASRSVSYLAAPAFAAAMVEQRVVGTIPVNRRVLLIAETPVYPGSPLDGRMIDAVLRPGLAMVIAVTRGRGRNRQTRWSPSRLDIVSANDVLTVVTTRNGLARMLVKTGDPLARMNPPAVGQPERAE